MHSLKRYQSHSTQPEQQRSSLLSRNSSVISQFDSHESHGRSTTLQGIDELDDHDETEVTDDPIALADKAKAFSSFYALENNQLSERLIGCSGFHVLGQSHRMLLLRPFSTETFPHRRRCRLKQVRPRPE